jgi:hypothetical protein
LCREDDEHGGRSLHPFGHRFAPIGGMPSELLPNASNRCAVLIGRTLAACVHPVPAWHSPARSYRVLLVAGYFTAGYVAGLAVMVLTM